MGRVNNPQAGERALVNRSEALGRLRQPMMALTDSAWRDVLSSEAERSRMMRNISADVANLDRPPLTGRASDLVAAATARTRVGSGSADSGYSNVENAAQQKRLKFFEGRSRRLGSAMQHQSGIAQRMQEDAEARQNKKNVKKGAIWNAVGTVAGAGLGAYANYGTGNSPFKKTPAPLNEAGVENVLARPLAQGVDVPLGSIDASKISADDLLGFGQLSQYTDFA